MRADPGHDAGSNTEAIEYGSANRLLFAGFLTFVTVFGISRFLYTPLLPLMQAQYGFDVDTAALLASANLGAYVVASLGLTFLRVGRHRQAIFRIAMVTSAASTIGMGLTGDVTAWVVLRVIAGVASAFGFLIAAAIAVESLSRVSEEGRWGWMYMGNGAAIVASGLFVAPASNYLTSSQIWVVLGCVAALFLPFIFKEMKVKPLRPRAARSTRQRHVPRPFPFWPLLFTYSISGVGYTIFATFIVAIIKARPGLEALADWVWVLTGLSALLSGVLGGWLAERIGYAQALLLIYFLLAVSIALPAISETGAVALLAAVLFGFGFVATAVLAMPLGQHGLGGRGFAFLTFGGGVGQVLGPMIAAQIVETQEDFSTALYFGAASMMLGVVVMYGGILYRNRHPL